MTGQAGPGARETVNRLTTAAMALRAACSGIEIKDYTAATGRAPRERLLEGYAEETSLAHMTRVATDTRSRETTEWITAHVRPGRRYRPPPGKGVRRTQLRRVRKTLAGRYYQLLSGRAETGTHRVRLDRTDTPECWWCTSGEPQPRHHLFTRCPAWRPQTRRLWKDIGEACRWERPRAPSVRYLWEGKATSAVLEFLRTTRMGYVGIGKVPPEDRGENEEGEEGDPGPP